MKQFIKRTAGGVIALVGVAGIVLSVCAIFGTWSTASRLEQQLPLAIRQLEAVGTSIDSRGAVAIEILQMTRDRLGSILESVKDLARDRTDRQLNPVLNRIDAEVVDRLERAEEFLLSMQGSLEGASRAATLLESVPFLRARGTPASGRNTGSESSLASNLTDVSRRLEHLTRTLAEIRASRTVNPDDLAQLTNILAGMQEQLVRVQTDVEGIAAETTGFLTRLADAKRRSIPWIRRVALICTVFFVCFGASQFNLMVPGLRSFSAAPQSVSGPSIDEQCL